MTALLAALSALWLIAYPTWGELKNPGLWMFAILAALAGVARGYWLRIYVDHTWRLMRLQRAYDCLVAAAGLIGLSLVEIALAWIGPADQPTMELGLPVVASFLIGRSAAVLLRARQEPRSDLHDAPVAAGRRIAVMKPTDCSRPAGRVGLSGRTSCEDAYLRR